MHPFTYQLLDLEDAASSYCAAMTLLDLYRATLPLELFGIANESVVEEFEKSIRSLCAFVGLPWTESMRKFGEKSVRQQIATPSANQVARGLSAEGIGQWRRYREQLAPILPMLRPWIEKFGYPAK
jgi:hypothetical protein